LHEAAGIRFSYARDLVVKIASSIIPEAEKLQKTFGYVGAENIIRIIGSMVTCLSDALDAGIAVNTGPYIDVAPGWPKLS